MLPIYYLGLESQTHSVQDTALSQLSVVLPILDFSTIKNELFPVVAHVFSKTSSMAIKIRGLEAFNVLCGGTNANGSDAKSLMVSQPKANSSSAVLDKYTIQEKMVPLLKGIKTKEPAVMVRSDFIFNTQSSNIEVVGRTRGIQASWQSCRRTFPGFRRPTRTLGILPWAIAQPRSVPAIHDVN